MERRYFERLDMTVFSDTLPNGLRLRVIPRPGFEKKYAFFATNYGSVDTAFTMDGVPVQSADGVAHYLEHKMFDTKDGNAMQAFSATGASPNAFTGYHVTAYHFACTDRFEENLEILLHFVSEPYFTPESVEKEQGIIAQEIKMYEDNPGSRLGENMFAAMYRHHPLRVPIAGTVESIRGITADMLYDCHRAFYDPSNMILCVVGDVDPDMVRQKALDILPTVPGGATARDFGPQEPELPAQREISQSMEVSMPMFAIGFKLPALPEGEVRLTQELLGDLAAEVLCGESSPLYQRLYERGLIDSGFSVCYESVRGLPNINASGDSDDPRAVLDAILEEAVRISREGVDEGLFQRLKRSSLGRRVRGLDSFDGMCYRMTISDFDGYDYFRFPELYDAITAESVREMIKKGITAERAVLSLILPK